MRRNVHFSVRGSNYEELHDAAQAKLRLLYGEDAILPFDAEFDISEGTEITADGMESVKIIWEADVTARSTDSSYQTT